MNAWLNLHTFLAFLLGVFASAMVKGWVSTARGKLGA
jgi:hypothetical protein